MAPRGGAEGTVSLAAVCGSGLVRGGQNEMPAGRHVQQRPYRHPFEGAALTVAVDVHGAGVPLTVVVRVDLRGVVHLWAVVAAIPHLVFVVVRLTGVEEKLAVVLEKQGGKNSGNSMQVSAAWSLRRLSPAGCVPRWSVWTHRKRTAQPNTFLISSHFIVIYVPVPLKNFEIFCSQDDTHTLHGEDRW